jgi:hypothetical protein
MNKPALFALAASAALLLALVAPATGKRGVVLTCLPTQPGNASVTAVGCCILGCMRQWCLLLFFPPGLLAFLHQPSAQASHGIWAEHQHQTAECMLCLVAVSKAD